MLVSEELTASRYSGLLPDCVSARLGDCRDQLCRVRCDKSRSMRSGWRGREYGGGSIGLRLEDQVRYR